MADCLPGLLLFARTPERGKVKTRLVPPLSEPEALDIYRAFLEDASVIYGTLGRWRPVLLAEPDPDAVSLAALFPPPWTRRRQAAGDLGERLASAFEMEFANGAPAAVAVGSDHPNLRRGSIEEAFLRLSAGDDAVVIPADDGGYCAIGLSARVRVRDVFEEIPWSSPRVLSATRDRFAALGIRVSYLESAYDVDLPGDLDRLRSDLARRDPSGGDYPRATAKALRELEVP